MSSKHVPNQTTQLNTSYFISKDFLDLGMFTDRCTHSKRSREMSGSVWYVWHSKISKSLLHLRTCCSFSARPPETPNPRSTYSQIRAVGFSDGYVHHISKSHFLNKFSDQQFHDILIYSLFHHMSHQIFLHEWWHLNGMTSVCVAWKPCPLEPARSLHSHHGHHSHLLLHHGLSNHNCLNF